MADFKAYEKYAYSDYFKTELPREWTEKRLGYISAYDKNSFVDGPFGSDLKSDDYKDSGVPLIQLNNIRDGKHVLQNYKFITEKKRLELSRHVALPNDIVIAKMAEPVARSAIVSNQYPEYVIVADCVKLSPDLDLVNLKFLNWAINSVLVKRNAELVSSGTTRIRVSLGELKKLKIPYPSLVEQKLIANFLDHETAQIDTLIDKQQTLIQLLKEKRQAVISHAVTKGLNPDAPMKDSGVEWLGEVPEHWVVTKFSHCAQIRNGLVDPKAPDFKKLVLYAPNHIEKGTGKVVYKETAEEQGADSSKYLCYKGEVIYSKIRPALAKVAICEEETALCSADMYPINAVNGLDNRFLYFFMLSDNFTKAAILDSDRVAMPKINRESLSDYRLPVPPVIEQMAICKFIANQNTKLEELESKATKAIQLMQERRTALISAAVTGKIDVRGWRASE